MSGRTEEFSWGVRVGGGVGERGERVGAVRGWGRRQFEVWVRVWKRG